VDRENTNHWLPATLLLLEYHLNCIPFSWRHIPIFLTMSTFYTLVNATYCLYNRVMIYPGVDWINNWPNALAKGQGAVLVYFLYFLVIKGLNRLKYKLRKINVNIK
jgi:hypothetical protein